VASSIKSNESKAIQKDKIPSFSPTRDIIPKKANSNGVPKMILPDDFTNNYQAYLKAATLQLFPDHEIKILSYEEKYKRDETRIQVFSIKELPLHEKLQGSHFSFVQRQKTDCIIAFTGNCNFPREQIEQYNSIVLLAELKSKQEMYYEQLIDGILDSATVQENIDLVEAQIAELEKQLSSELHLA
jgi:hypothetical protein